MKTRLSEKQHNVIDGCVNHGNDHVHGKTPQVKALVRRGLAEYEKYDVIQYFRLTEDGYAYARQTGILKSPDVPDYFDMVELSRRGYVEPVEFPQEVLDALPDGSLVSIGMHVLISFAGNITASFYVKNDDATYHAKRETLDHLTVEDLADHIQHLQERMQILKVLQDNVPQIEVWRDYRESIGNYDPIRVKGE